MTTRVTIDAHAGWDVKVVTCVPDSDDAPGVVQIVPGNTTRDFYIHDGLNIVLIEEVKKG